VSWKKKKDEEKKDDFFSSSIFFPLFSSYLVAFRVPVGRADLSVLIRELERLNETNSFVDGASDGEIVDGDLTESSLGVDKEETTKRNTSILDQDAVVASDLHRLVGDELELEIRSESSLVAVGVGPGKVRVFRVAGDGENLGVELGKVSETLVESENFGRANEGD